VPLYGTVEPGDNTVLWWFELWNIDPHGRKQNLLSTFPQLRASGQGIGQVSADTKDLSSGLYYYRLAGVTSDGKSLPASDEGTFGLYLDFAESPVEPPIYSPKPWTPPVPHADVVGKRYVVRGKSVKLRLSCPAVDWGGCDGRVVLRTARTVATNKKKKRKKHLKLGSATFQLKGGEEKVVRVKLRASMHKHLAGTVVPINVGFNGSSQTAKTKTRHIKLVITKNKKSKKSES